LTRRVCATIKPIQAKRPCNMFSMKQEFNNLLSKKKEYLIRQRRCSLLIDPLKTEDNPLIPESIIIEWPKVVDGISPTDERVEIDMAPLIHRARNVVKCRTSHPTMRVKYVGKNTENDAILPQPKTVEAFFRASLVKLLHDGTTCCRQAAGRMILTQREGTPAAKNLDQNGATVSNGKLIASQAASNNVSRVLVERMDERDAKTTPFKYDNHVLCATFPEMGVALNSMVDRRQLATRYAIQVEVAINIDNKLIVNHVALSHPFLIAITNDQTEPLLYSIFWSRMLASEHNVSLTDNSTIPWTVLRQAIQNYVKAQVVQARSLQYHEVCHIQCMIFLPRVIRCKTVEELNSLELELYGNVKGSSTTNRVKEIRDRLLTEQVLPTCLIERRELMVDKCISCLDMSTELQHTVWSWLFKGTEMLQDVGHKLCPSPIMGEKKGSKTKKQMAACEEYQTMLSLFNKGSLSLQRIFRDSSVMGNEAILIRICDENCGFLSFVFGFEKLRMGSLSAEHVKDLKQGLPEVLIDEPFPAKFEYLIKIDAVDHQKYDMTISLKRAIFNNYETMRLDPSVHVHDDESVRINPLTGAKVTRTSPPTNDLVQPSPFLVPRKNFTLSSGLSLWGFI
uniref:NARG2_C domain-containing protein n=1 Tax=Haemonchus placei TaxID=6290 RepID=A0A158QN30_HAEPC